MVKSLSAVEIYPKLAGSWDSGLLPWRLPVCQIQLFFAAGWLEAGEPLRAALRAAISRARWSRVYFSCTESNLRLKGLRV